MCTELSMLAGDLCVQKPGLCDNNSYLRSVWGNIKQGHNIIEYQRTWRLCPILCASDAETRARQGTDISELHESAGEQDLPCNSCNSTSGYEPKGSESRLSNRYLYTRALSIMIHNSQVVEATQCPWTAAQMKNCGLHTQQNIVQP